jgi:uncharacterized protein
MSLKIILIISILISTYSTSFADRSSDIRYLLSISGIGDMLEGMVNYQADLTVNEFKKNRKIAKEFERDFKNVIIEVLLADFWSPGGLADMLLPAYDGFSNSEIKELIKFYESPMGKKMLKNTPKIEIIIRNLVPAWNMRVNDVILPKIVDKMRAKGYDNEGKRLE